MKYNRLALAALLTLSAGSAFAHVGEHGQASFFSGFGHPLGGLDHLLAMLAVGLFAARQVGASRLAVPLGFVVAMLVGAGLSALGVALPVVEAGIAASVLVFGLLIAFLVRLPTAVALPLVGAFALFHGHAHHAEMGDGSVLAYVVGFAIATALLHAAGFVVARWVPDSRTGLIAKRVTGAGIAGAGAVLLGG